MLCLSTTSHKLSTDSNMAATLKTLVVLLHLALARGQIQGVYYGNKCYLADDPLDVREAMADVVFTGRVTAIHRNPLNATYSSSIYIYRVMKGGSIVTALLDLSSDVTLHYNRTVEVAGFGNEQICDSDVTLNDTKIFLVSFHRSTNLTLNSSLTRVGVRALRKSLADKIAKDETLSACKYFFCAFYAECKLGFWTQEPYCQCPDCQYEPLNKVCGTDGNWYDNVCMTKRISCLKKRRIRPTDASQCTGGDKSVPSATRTTTTATATTVEEQKLCEKEACEYNAECKISVDGRSAKCECIAQCDSYGDSDGSEPVCGTDGQDYDSECHLKMTSCEKQIDIMVAKPGRCDPCKGKLCADGQVCQLESQKPVCTCVMECEDNKQPVCASDGRTYSNECLLRHAACLQPESSISIAYQGACNFSKNPCEDIECKSHATCRVDGRGVATCRCPDRCPVGTNPVCGSNGVEYDSLCTLKQQACVLDTNITAVSQPPCVKDNCTGYSCPYDGVCRLEGDVPTCVCPVCSAVISPVCADNGLTFTNQCVLRRFNCENEEQVKVSHMGACNMCDEEMKCEYGNCRNTNGSAMCLCADDDACIKNYNPLCADDGKTYENMCQVVLASCREQKKISKVADGSCDGRVCTRTAPCLYKGTCLGTRCLCDFNCVGEQEDYVCGTDKKTYENECSLEKRACDTQTMIQVASRGPCSDMMGGSDGDGGGADGAAGGLIDKLETTTFGLMAGCLEGTTCKYEGRCDYTQGPPGICRCEGFFDFCGQSDSEPVCGSDGTIYKNICGLRMARCELQQELSPKPMSFCDGEVDSSVSPPVSQCNDIQPALLEAGNTINCSSCLPDRAGQCELCPSNGYCSNRGFCCPKDPSVPLCTYSQFGCCLYNKEIASPGPDNRGCPSSGDDKLHTCECHEFGANGRLCDPTNFQCDCKPGIVGTTCDQCKLGWWGLALIKTSGNNGCLPCQCNALGSMREDCEQNSGRCLCKEGVTGFKCDMCSEPGMMLTSNGCVKVDEGKDEVTSCGTLDCGNGQCVIDDVKGAICTCSYSCPDELDYICGTDGQTYQNGCHLRRAACHDGTLMVLREGACDETTTLPSTTESTIPTTTTESSGFWWFGGGKRYLADEGGRDDKKMDLKRRGQSTCEDRPCANYGTCLDDDKIGFKCLCAATYQGRKCEQRGEFTIPSFNGNSYMVMQWPMKRKDTIDLHLTIIPTNASGVLLYNGNLDGLGDFMSLVLDNLRVEFRFRTGKHTILVRSKQMFSLYTKTSIRIRRNGSVGFLEVNGKQTVNNHVSSRSRRLNSEPSLYIGHVTVDIHRPLSRRLIENLGGVVVGYKGCVNEIHDATHNINFLFWSGLESLLLRGRLISECTDDPCLNVPCFNQGFCEMKDSFNYRCDCRSGFSGDRCERKSQSVRDLLMSGLYRKVLGYEDDVFQIPKFTGNSYLRYRIPQYSNTHFEMKLVFLTDSQSGVLLYSSQAVDGKNMDYILLSLEEQVLVLRYDLGSGVTTLRWHEKITLKKWTMVTMTCINKRATLSVNEQPPVEAVSQGQLSALDIQDYITIGAIPKEVEHDKTYLHSPGLTGVIQRVSVNGRDIVDFFHEAVRRHRVKRYDGQPCYPNPCQAGLLCTPEMDSYRCDLR